ncbi:MAG: hypothetical protein LBK62_04950 [Treponema sp.]|jgi:hypothetical protein|nr:hypothetical protein [Treponema sp.]
MATIHERFEMRGVHYTEIHFKVTPFARDLITHCYRNGKEISAADYQTAKAEYKRVWSAAHGF